MDVSPLLETSDRDELRRWLRRNHRTARQVWVVMFRKNRPAWAALSYVEIVEEALCFGWIDSTNKRLPDGRLAQRISPRRPGGHWTELNLRRFADLVRRRKMTAAGRAAHSGWRETGLDFEEAGIPHVPKKVFRGGAG